MVPPYKVGKKLTFFPACKGKPGKAGEKSTSYFPAKWDFAVNKVKYEK